LALANDDVLLTPDAALRRYEVPVMDART
jgi:hypothetical protein